MQMVKTKLNTENENDEYNLITVWFNAWRYEKEVHPILPLIATIISEINKNKSFVKKIGDEGKSFVTALRAIAYGFSAKSKVKLPGFAEIEASFVAKDMIDREEKLSADPLLDRSLYFNAFERLSEIELPENTKIIIFVDDLDRCFPNHAIKLLESIKLILCQPGFTFFLGVARRVIEGYLEYRYNTKFGITDFIGAEYMDKIVQLQFEIPDHQYRMSKNEYKDKIMGILVDDNHKKIVEELVPVIGPVSGGNPRKIIRFINSLLIDEAINTNLKETKIPIQFFAISRALQQFWREMFYTLIDNNELCAEFERFLGNDGTIPEDNKLKDVSIRNWDNLLKLMKTQMGRAWLSDHDSRRHSHDFIEHVTKYSDAEEVVYDSLDSFHFMYLVTIMPHPRPGVTDDGVVGTEAVQRTWKYDAELKAAILEAKVVGWKVFHCGFGRWQIGTKGRSLRPGDNRVLFTVSVGIARVPESRVFRRMEKLPGAYGTVIRSAVSTLFPSGEVTVTQIGSNMQAVGAVDQD